MSHSEEYKDGNFLFYPVDNPVKIYKSVVIDHPKINVYQDKDKLSISVVGYQCMKEGGYSRTTTTIENIREQ